MTASNSGGQTSATSATVGTVLPPAPADSTAPGISGTAQQGNTLTASHGLWNNNPTGYTYAWQDCDSTGSNCATIAGAHVEYLRAHRGGRRELRERDRDGDELRWLGIGDEHELSAPCCHRLR